MPKLTLSINEELVELAKQIAAQNNTSISAMFSQYITSLTETDKHPKLSPLAKKASGLVQLPPDKTDKELLTDALLEKYS